MSVVPLNLDLGISNQLGWVSFTEARYFIGFKPIPLDALSTSSLGKPLVKGSAVLSLDLT